MNLKKKQCWGVAFGKEFQPSQSSERIEVKVSLLNFAPELQHLNISVTLQITKYFFCISHIGSVKFAETCTLAQLQHNVLNFDGNFVGPCRFHYNIYRHGEFVKEPQGIVVFSFCVFSRCKSGAVGIVEG